MSLIYIDCVALLILSNPRSHSNMGSFGNSVSCSSSSLTHLLETPPTIIHNLASIPDTLQDGDDVSIIETVPADLDSRNTEDTSESCYCNADIYNNSFTQDDYLTAKLSVNLVRFDTGM